MFEIYVCLFFSDSVPHVPDADLDQEKVYTLIGNVTDELMTVFPNTTIFPVLGNHDPYPANMMPYDVETTKYYKGILESSQWSEVLGHNESQQFHNGKVYEKRLLLVLGHNESHGFIMVKSMRNVCFQYLDTMRVMVL